MCHKNQLEAVLVVAPDQLSVITQFDGPMTTRPNVFLSVWPRPRLTRRRRAKKQGWPGRRRLSCAGRSKS
jgi:hypothetical protein